VKVRGVGWQRFIRIWESGEWQTRTAECRQRSANPLPGKQMVVALATRKAGRNAQPSFSVCVVYVCIGAGDGIRTRDVLLGRIMSAPLNLFQAPRAVFGPSWPPVSKTLGPLSPPDSITRLGS